MNGMRRRVPFYGQREDHLLHTGHSDHNPFILFWVHMDYSEDIERLVIRCPKCGAFYSLKEVDKTFEWMRGELKELRRWSLVPTPWHSIFGFLVLEVKRQRRLRTGNFPCLFININTNEKDVAIIHIIAPELLRKSKDRFLGNSVRVFSSFW